MPRISADDETPPAAAWDSVFLSRGAGIALAAIGLGAPSEAVWHVGLTVEWVFALVGASLGLLQAFGRPLLGNEARRRIIWSTGCSLTALALLIDRGSLAGALSLGGLAIAPWAIPLWLSPPPER
jgi:hypothetical protein